MTAQPAGPIIDGLNVTLDIDDGDLVSTALVLAKVVTADGNVGLVISDSDTMNWLDQLALITAATNLINANQSNDRDD